MTPRTHLVVYFAWTWFLVCVTSPAVYWVMGRPYSFWHGALVATGVAAAATGSTWLCSVGLARWKARRQVLTLEPGGPVRVCRRCRLPIGRKDRWRFIPGNSGLDVGLEHHDCSDPTKVTR